MGLGMSAKTTKLIRAIFDEGKRYLDKGDPMQASEKFYKVVEECIKLLAKKHKLPEHEEAIKEGRWWSKLLTRAARRLARESKQSMIEDAWARAFDLHVWGFHERVLEVEDVEQDVRHLQWLIDYTEGATS